MSVQKKTVNWGPWVAVTLILGSAAFLTSPNAPLGGFWGTPAMEAAPQGVQRALFLLLNAIQALAFGLGVAFLLFGRWMIRVQGGAGTATHLAIAWSLLSWWLHSNLHQTHDSENLAGLLAIEYGFHVTLILGSVIIAWLFLTRAQQA